MQHENYYYIIAIFVSPDTAAGANSSVIRGAAKDYQIVQSPLLMLMALVKLIEPAKR